MERLFDFKATRMYKFPLSLQAVISLAFVLCMVVSDCQPTLPRRSKPAAIFVSAGLMSSPVFLLGARAGEGYEHDAAASYPPLEKIEERFARLVAAYPHLAAMYQIGESAANRRPIWAIRVSDNPDLDEDEPAVLFNGVQHAREPMGAFICTELLEELLKQYDANPMYRRFVDSLEIWLVPMVNPDGYKYIIDNRLGFPWWRKNLRDNNGDGIFNPLIDGVDLNRNYGYNWGDGDERAPGSWFFHGSAAFSEPEIRALRDLARRENVVLGVDYHSYGESVLFPWGNFHPAPDHALISDIAENCARRISREGDHGQYGTLPLNARVGQSSIWMYGELGAIHFIIETATHYFPGLDRVPGIAKENLRGAEFLLARALGSGISGHVRDAETGKPIMAEIQVDGLHVPYVRPRHSDGLFGRFDRLLLPGSYKLAIVAAGYVPAIFTDVRVRPDERTHMQVALRRLEISATGAN
jgi:hypothetical protein